MIRRTQPIEVVSQALPGITIRARPLTLHDAYRLANYRADTPLAVEEVAKLAAFLDGLSFVVTDGTKPYTAVEFLGEADLWTVQAVLVALLSGNAFGAQVEAPAQQPTDFNVDPE